MTNRQRTVITNWPWGLTGAILLMIGIEIGVRAADPVQLIPNERGVLNYKANRLALQSNIVPDVVFVGSSRTQQGILPDVFQELINDTYTQTTVGNLAVGGALATENVPMMRLMLEQERLPKLLVYGVTMDQVRGDELYSERSAIYSNLSHWKHDRAQYGKVVDDHLPEVLRNEISNVYQTFRYRDRAVVALRDLGRGELPKPFLGQRVAEHFTENHKTKHIEDTPELRADIRDHLEDVHLKNGRYNFNDAKFKMISDVISKLKAAGVSVVLFEPPNSTPFNEELPTGTLEEYRLRFQRIADQNKIPFITLHELQTSFKITEFCDPVHLNTNGAQHLTESLAETLKRRQLIP